MKKNLDYRHESDNDKRAEKESIPRLFGRNVRKYRKERGFTQEQLSEKLGISQKHLSIIETGTQFASASLIERLCVELAVSPADLFGGSNDEILREIRKSRDMIMMVIETEIRRYS